MVKEYKAGRNPPIHYLQTGKVCKKFAQSLTGFLFVRNYLPFWILINKIIMKNIV